MLGGAGAASARAVRQGPPEEATFTCSPEQGAGANFAHGKELGAS